jgi:site-specific DNA recombinase
MTVIAGIYSRISQDAEDTGDATRRQEQDCHELAKRKGWTVAEVYRDNDVSATRSKPRPAYQRMMQDLRDGRINAVLVYDVDRLTRHPMELEEFILLADSHGVKLDNVAGNIDLSSDDGRLMARIKGSLAKAETDKMSKRLKRQRQQHMEEGRPPVGGRYRTYGYTREWKIVPEEAEVIRETFRRVIVGESLQAIANTWRDESRKIGSGKAVYRSTVTGIVKRGLYAGLSVHKGEVVGKSQVPAIIDEATFYAASAALEKRAPTEQRGKNARRYYLAGMIRCANCLAPMQGGPVSAKSSKSGFRYKYACKTGQGGCGASVSAKPVESIVLEVVRQSLIVKKHPLKVPKVDYSPQIAKIEDDKAAVHEARRAGSIPIVEAIKMITDLTDEQNALKRKDAEQLVESENAFADWDGFKTATLSEQKSITNRLISTVLIQRAGSAGTTFNPDRVEVHLVNGTVINGGAVYKKTLPLAEHIIDGFRAVPNAAS